MYFRKKAKIAVSLVLAMLMVVTSFITVNAEGGTSLNNSDKSDAYRMYSEWQNSSTIGLERKNIVYAYAFAGETVYFGSSVYDSTLNIDGTVNTGSVTGNDIVVVDPSGTKTPYDVLNSGTNAGYIDTAAKEKAGAYIDGINESENAYTPLSFTAPSSGVYEFHFHSKTGKETSGEHSSPIDGEFTQSTSKVAAWDIEVSNGTTVKSGRTFANYLALDSGDFVSPTYPVVYVLTDDGYQYKVELNGFSPYGYIMFANNRGICTVGPDSHPVYHSVGTSGLANISTNNAVQYKIPSSVNTDIDKSYKIFFEKPSKDLEGILYSPPQEPSTVENLEFHGSKTENISYLDQGGYFTFDIESGSSVTISLDFGNGNTVTLSNAVVPGENTFYWDGKYDSGEIVPVGQYKLSDITVTSIVKSGEIHFPFVDVESMKDITITRLNGDDMTDNTMLYYNNLPLTDNVIEKGESVVSAGTKKFKLADGTYTYNTYTLLPNPDGTAGVDSAASTNTLQMSYSKATPASGGNDAIIDAWTYYPGKEVTQTYTSEEIVIVDESDVGSIVGSVFFDYDGKGGEFLSSNGDYGMSGVTVNLLDSNRDIIDTAVTSASGTYHFYGVKYGTYTVEPSVNTMVYTNTTNNASQSVTVNKDSVNATDVGYYYEAGANDIVVKKTWVNGVSTLDCVYVQLYASYVDSNGETNTIPAYDPVALKATESWMTTYTNLPSTVDGYTISYYVSEYYYDSQNNYTLMGTSQMIGDPDNIVYSDGTVTEEGYSASFEWSRRSASEYLMTITNTPPTDYVVRFHSNMDGLTDLFKVYASKADSAYNHDAVLTTEKKIEEFKDIPVCADENNTYIFKGWYYADGTPIKWNTDKYLTTTDVYAQWENIGTVAKDAKDEKITGLSTYSGFDLFGMQIRTDKYDITDSSGNVVDKVSGMRYVTSYSNALITDLNSLFIGKEYGNYKYSSLKYGYSLAKKAKLEAAGYGTDYKLTPDCTVAKMVDCTRDVTTAYPTNKDHRNYDEYRISSMVVMYNNDGSKPQAEIDAAKAADVVARPYIIYTDANGIERIVYNTYTGSSLLYGGCCTSFNSVWSYVQSNPDHDVD